MKIFLALIFVLTIYNCQKVSSPTAHSFTIFDFSNNVIDFTVEQFSIGKDDNVYHWEFGDSSIGQGASVKHKYPKPGKYIVKLKTFNSDGIFIDQKEIIVKDGSIQNPFDTLKTQKGSFEINTIQLQKYSLKKQNGDNWDPAFNPEPDIFFKVLSSNGAALLKSNQFTPFSLPQDYFPSPFGTLLSTSTTYTIQLLDDEFHEGGGEEVMASKTIKLSDYIQASSPNPKLIQIELDKDNIIQLEFNW